MAHRDKAEGRPKAVECRRKRPRRGLRHLREVRGRIATGKVLGILSNDLDSAEESAAPSKRRRQIALFFRWVKQTLKIRHFRGRSENAGRIPCAFRAHSARRRADRLRALAPCSSRPKSRTEPACFCPSRARQSQASQAHRSPHGAWPKPKAMRRSAKPRARPMLNRTAVVFPRTSFSAATSSIGAARGFFSGRLSSSCVLSFWASDTPKPPTSPSIDRRCVR